jgi:glycosyltransferase involved in cell wall biosynthesis
VNILLIVPLPPPIGGHALASNALFEELAKYHNVEVVNFNKESFEEGLNSLKRIIKVFNILLEVWHKKKYAEIIYITISESFAGNIKDLIIYFICHNKLNNMFIHLHGGSIKKLLWDRQKILFNVNKIIINKLAGVIISGRSHIEIFANIVPLRKIHIVPNFAQDYLFLSEEKIREKFAFIKSIKILYMSNFINEKGYNELVDAYLGLNNYQKDMITIDFAGRFDSEERKGKFLRKIDKVDQIRYHGVVCDSKKRKLFSNAHVFCLPTSLFEGQPISILEAYASGCVVITTGQPGIRDIFTNGKNGFELQKRSANSIKSVIEEIIGSRDKLLPIAIKNRKLAGDKYRLSNNTGLLRKILESHISGISQNN